MATGYIVEYLILIYLVGFIYLLAYGVPLNPKPLLTLVVDLVSTIWKRFSGRPLLLGVILQVLGLRHWFSGLLLHTWVGVLVFPHYVCRRKLIDGGFMSIC